MKKNLWGEQDFCCKPALTGLIIFAEAKVIISPTTSEILFSGQRTREGGRGTVLLNGKESSQAKSAGERTMATPGESVC